MHCLECAEEHLETPAVAACGDCGAGVCLDHLLQRRPNGRTVSTIGPVGRTVTIGSRVRRLLCVVCAMQHVRAYAPA